MTDYGKQLFNMVQQDTYDAMAQAVKEAQRENALEYQRKMTAKDEVLKVCPEALCEPIFDEGFDAIEPDAYRVYATPQRIRALSERDTESDAWEDALNRIREKQDEV